ncbi:MAG: hypothetical protein ACYDG2_16960 [Ruminiclostridium sp.]
MKALGFTSRYIILQNIYKYLIMAVFSAILALCLHMAVSKEMLAALLIDAFINSEQSLLLLVFGFIALIIIAVFIICLRIKKISLVELMEEWKSDIM